MRGASIAQKERWKLSKGELVATGSDCVNFACMRNAPGEIVKNATIENTKQKLDGVSLSPLQHDEFANRMRQPTASQALIQVVPEGVSTSRSKAPTEFLDHQLSWLSRHCHMQVQIPTFSVNSAARFILQLNVGLARKQQKHLELDYLPHTNSEAR